MSQMEVSGLNSQPQDMTECPYLAKQLATPQSDKKTCLALAMGGLVDDHVLILPIAHYASSVAVQRSLRKLTGVPYFYVELPTREKLYCRIQGNSNFPLQFGREVLASPGILNMSERVDWKDCNQLAHKSSQATDFKSKFRKYDFTIE